jgi:hypothetical protein
MAGYSGTPLARKLGVAEGSRLALVHAPGPIPELDETLPDGVDVVSRPRTPVDVVLAFYLRRTALEREFTRLSGMIQPAGGLWIAWPKRAAKIDTDLDENIVRDIGLASGLVDNKVCAIDATWSGLRFVVRLRDR